MQAFSKNQSMINFKSPLRPQKYYIIQHGEVGSSGIAYSEERCSHYQFPLPSQMYISLSKVLAKQSQLKPTRAKFTTSKELGFVSPPTSRLELAWIWSSLNFRPTRAKFSTVWPPQPNQSNSSQVVLLLLCDYAVVFRQLNGFLQAGSTWWNRLVTRRCTFWFL